MDLAHFYPAILIGFIEELAWESSLLSGQKQKFTMLLKYVFCPNLVEI